MYRVEMEQQVASSRKSLGEKTFGPLFAEGTAMSLEEAAQCALEVTAGRK
jgi:hypothetical protein